MPSLQDAVPPAGAQPHPLHWIRGVVFTALFAALFIAFTFVTVPLWFTPVPITLSTLAIMLAGGLLGAVYGFASIALVVVLAAAGLPLFHGSGGLSLILGTSGGYVWMYPIAALLIGFVSDSLFRSRKPLSTFKFVVLLIAIFLFGSLLLYVTGVPWLAYKAEYSMQKAMALGCYPFLLGDAIKAAVAALLIRKLRPMLPRFRP
ncbi:biotin transporter BioY [Paenibacillus humicola]|uniref:biotin transporter BioY n=1 Tax=Paenibacillus humicola TaxID=3110540 RepID=UPI00237B6BB5|nr:biotin transporter BioY [Paenibacillus humicola]